jgi:hypothetical protein
MKFRKKPVVIEAVPVHEVCKNASGNWQALPEWVKAGYEAGNLIIRPEGLTVATLEGPHEALTTDMLIQGVAGELYPCKIDIFNKTYEAVEL